MPSVDLSHLTNEQRPTGIWAASLLHALARDEAAGRRTRRLTELKLDTWNRFRGRLNSADFVAMLFEDAAVIHRIPFDPAALRASTTIAQSIVHRGVRKWFRRWSPKSCVFNKIGRGLRCPER